MKKTNKTPTKVVMSFVISSILCSLSHADVNPRPAPAQASGARAGYDTILSQPISRPVSDDKEEVDAIEDSNIPDNGKKVFVSEIKIEGNDIFDNETLLPLISRYLNKELSFSDIKAIGAIIENHYNKEGYQIVKVYIPKGALKGSVLTIGVLEGKLGKVNVSGNNRYSTEKIEKTMYSYLEQGKAFTIPEVESPLVLLGSYPALSVKSALSAGEEVGTTDINVEVKEDKIVTASLEANNFGSKSTGEYRIIPYVAFQNPFGFGDELSLFGVLSPDQIDTWSYQVGYSIPVTSFGTSFAAYFGQGNNTVTGSSYDVLDIGGTSMSWGAGFTHKFIWSSKTQLTLEAMFDWLDVDSSANAFGLSLYEDGVRKVRVGATLDHKDSTGRTIASLYLHQGIGEYLGGTEHSYENSSRSYSQADNVFSKFVLGIVRVQSLLPKLYAILNVTAQYSTDPLVASEQLYLGGANSIRGQPYSEAAGDDGVIVNAELRYSVLSNDPSLQLAAFIDYGTSHIKTTTYEQEEWTTLGGAGAGIRSQLFECVDMRFDVAVPVGKSYGDSVYFYGQIRYVF